MGKPVVKMLLGGAAGIIIWMIFEPQIPSNPYSSIGQQVAGQLVMWLGLAIGLVIGGFNGWQQGSKVHLIRGLALGAIFGWIGAGLGAALGNALISPFDGGAILLRGPIYLQIPVRILALSPIGLFIGTGVGASTLSWKRAIQGAIGGLIGGGIGALMFDPVSSTLGSMFVTSAPGHGPQETGTIARAIYCLLLGAGIGLFVGIMENVGKVAWLRLAAGRNEGREWPVDLAQTVIGRSETANVPLFGDSAVAPKHATIHRRNDEYLLVDEGSQTGTYVNGQKVSQQPLFHGAVIQIGGYRLEFLMKVGSAPQRAAEALRSQNAFGLQAAAAGAPYAMPAGQFHPGMPAAMAPTYMPQQPPASMPTQMAPQQGPTQMAQPTNLSYPQSVPTQVVSPQPSHAIDTLVATTGPLTGQRFPISGNLEIGREGSGIPLSFDTSASRKHANVATSPGGPILTDLGSTNGTFVNDQRVQAASLVKGDLVKIGITTFRVE